MKQIIEEQIFGRYREFLEKNETLYEIQNKKNYGNFSITEVHCIDNIGTLTYPNVTQIASSMKITKGAITKVTSRLIEKSLIRKYKSEGNKKEVLFELTEEGWVLFNKHKEIHNEEMDRKIKLFSEFSTDEKQAIDKFFKNLNNYITERIEDY